MKLFLFVLVLCFCSFSAKAQHEHIDFCKQVAEFVPIENSKYTDGDIVPADLNALENPLDSSISIPVDINLAEYFNRPELGSIPGLNLEPEIANIEVNQDGSVFYNGQEISQDIQRLCGTSVVQEGEAVQPKPVEIKPKPKTVAPAPKPIVKPKAALKPIEKKSSVRVFNGPKTVIADQPVIEPEKQMAESENAIDVDALDAQKNTEDDAIIEGQYP